MHEPLAASLKRRTEYREAVERAGKTERELDYCATHPLHWINHHVLTYDPRLTPAVRPFDLWPRQADLICWLSEREQKQEGGLIVKARDMGVTFLCTAFALHQFLFRRGCSIGFGSRKLELVDRLGDMDSLFEKIRFMLYALPAWMLPRGFDRKRDDNHARVLNPANESSLTGEGGENIGRGGRKTIYFVDEAAFLEHPESIDRALSATTRVRIDASTPNGLGNPFATKRFGGAFPVFEFSWRDDPRKDDAWYAEQVRTLGPTTVAQEIDRDFSASVEGICIPAAWVRAAVGLALPSGPRVVAGLDVGEYGSDPSVFIARAGPVVRPPVAWGRCNATETAWRARDEAVKSGAAVVCYDAGGVGAGVRGAWETATTLPFGPLAVLFGESPTDDYWPDGKTSKEKVLNLRAEMWWKLRARFEKAYEFVEKGTRHPPDEMISIPDHPQLIVELSLPIAERTETGKIKLESKDKMRARGVKSPNFADALAVAFHATDYGPWDGAPDPAARMETARFPAEVFGGADRDEDDDDRKPTTGPEAASASRTCGDGARRPQWR